MSGKLLAMHVRQLLAASVACGAVVWMASPVAQEPPARLTIVPASQVRITDEFWSPRIEANRTVSIQAVYDRSAPRAPAQLIEAAAYMLRERPDADLERRTEEAIARSITAMKGRLDNPDQVIRTSGTFLEAAVAYYRMTGKRAALDAAIESANAMAAAYGPGKKTYISGHEGLKIGLLRLHEETRDPRYLDLARFLLDERGKDDYPRTGEYALDRTYAQDHLPVVRQAEAVGHAVRATYLYIPLAELAWLTGRPDYRLASNRIWEDATFRKTYVTGAIGSIRFHEQFGAPYELPNLSAWNETCASYGSIVWNHRMFLLHQDARYLDLFERTLYNAFLDGVSLDGSRFFYQNPLMSYGNYERFEWINTPCCPPNVVRLIASLGSYVYTTGPRDLYVNLFVGSEASAKVGTTHVSLRQETRYPWDGRVRLHVDPEQTARFGVRLRVPGWTGTQVIPGDLYGFMDRRREPVTLRVNGKTTAVQTVQGFAVIDRTWTNGDVVELNLPMPVRRVVARADVHDDAGRVALVRGPLVYSAEWPDNGGRALNIVVPDNATLDAEFRRDLLGGVTVIKGVAQAVARGTDGGTVARPHQLVAIPYFAWANRGMGEMQTWLPRTPVLARVTPVVPPSPVATVRSSGGIEKKVTGYNDQNDDIAAVYDGITPLNSADESNLYFRMRPAVGQPAWIEYAFTRPTRVGASEVYFADDRRFCKLPVSWRMLYKDGGDWKPVATQNAYAVRKDTFNRVAFAPVTTTSVRIEIEPVTRHYKSGEIGPPEAMFLTRDIAWRELGVIEWRVR